LKKINAKSAQKGRRGQSLIEVVLLLPVLVILMSMVTWFGRIVLTRQMLLTAARYGTDMIYYTDMDASAIKQEIRNYLTDKSVEGRRLRKEKLTDDKINVKINRAPTLSPLVFPNAAQILDFSKTSYVEVSYEFGVPTIFTAFSSYISNPGELPDSIVVSARSEVLAGTGAKH